MSLSRLLLIVFVIHIVRCNETADVTVEFAGPEDPKPVVELETSSLPSPKIETDQSNTSSANVSSETKPKVKVECASKVIPDNEVPKVQVINSTMLIKYLTPPASNNASTNECAVVLFYSSQCVFSARMAPHFNALARVYPNITFYAVDVMDYGNLHVRYGLVYVPNVMLFHNGKPIARINETTMNLEMFVLFISGLTGQTHDEKNLNVTSADMIGPVPSTLTKRVDYVLILAWVFTIACLCYGFIKSSFCRRFVDLIKNTWQEAAAAQHEHVD